MRVENHTTNPGEANAKPEDKTGVKEQPVKQEKPKEKKKKTAFQAVLKQSGLALLFLMIGMLAILLALYLPTFRKLQTAQSELDRLVPIETQYLALQQSSEVNEAKSLVYKLMSNTSRLIEAVNDNNSARISQYVIYIEEDLSQLEISDLPELTSNLSTQFSKISASITSSPTTTADDLEDFYNDLLLLADNLE